MIVKLSELASAMDKVSDMTFKEKNIPGVMLDMKDNGFYMCYCSSGKVVSSFVNAVMTDKDPKKPVIFGYTEFTRIIEACKPSGSIITDDITFDFEERIAVVKAQKKIRVLDRQTGKVKYEKIISEIEQTLNWMTSDASNNRVKALVQQKYDIYKHFSDDYISEHYPDDSIERPLSDSEFSDVVDTWDRDELKSTLTRLAIEDSTTVIISAKNRMAFVSGQNGVTVIPIKDKIKNSFSNSAVAARAMATLIGRFPADQQTVDIHTIDGNKVVFTSDDGDTFASLTNIPVKGTVSFVKATISMDYNAYMLNFNREVLESVLNGAKMAGSADKLLISFEKTNKSGIIKPTIEQEDNQIEMTSGNEGDSLNNSANEDDEEFGSGGPLTQEQLSKDAEDIGRALDESSENAQYIKMVIIIKNTLKSIMNRYEILTDKVIDPNDDIDKLRISIGIDSFIQAVKGAKTEYIAIDFNNINMNSNNNSVSVRIGEIDLLQMAKITSDEKLDRKWPDNKTIEHRKDILGYTTYLTATKEAAES